MACGVGGLLLCLFALFVGFKVDEVNMYPANSKGVFVVEAEQGTSQVSYYVPEDKRGIETGEGFVAGSAVLRLHLFLWAKY